MALLEDEAGTLLKEAGLTNKGGPPGAGPSFDPSEEERLFHVRRVSDRTGEVAGLGVRASPLQRLNLLPPEPENHGGRLGGDLDGQQAARQLGVGGCSGEVRCKMVRDEEAVAWCQERTQTVGEPANVGTLRRGSGARNLVVTDDGDTIRRKEVKEVEVCGKQRRFRQVVFRNLLQKGIAGSLHAQVLFFDLLPFMAAQLRAQHCSETIALFQKDIVRGYRLAVLTVDQAPEFAIEKDREGEGGPHAGPAQRVETQAGNALQQTSLQVRQAG